MKKKEPKINYTFEDKDVSLNESIKEIARLANILVEIYFEKQEKNNSEKQ